MAGIEKTEGTEATSPAERPPGVSWLVSGPVLVVRFNRPPDGESAVTLQRLTTEAEARGEKVSFVGVVPNLLQVPTAEFRRALTGQSTPIRDGAHALYFAIEGTGLMANLQRGMLSALAVVLTGNVPFSIHASGEAALRKAAGERGLDVEALVLRAKQEGLIR
ncbi:MAG: hypothetical protein Q8L14_39105 [Myxococcales bacterium]|nr:hypothetical protein [Myxococcales bacterium]